MKREREREKREERREIFYFRGFHHWSNQSGTSPDVNIRIRSSFWTQCFTQFIAELQWGPMVQSITHTRGKAFAQQRTERYASVERRHQSCSFFFFLFFYPLKYLVNYSFMNEQRYDERGRKKKKKLCVRWNWWSMQVQSRAKVAKKEYTPSQPVLPPTDSLTGERELLLRFTTARQQ